MKTKIIHEYNSTHAERQQLFSQAGALAVAEAKAAKLPITYASGTEIIKEYPDGRKEIIGKTAGSLKVTSKVIHIPAHGK